MAVVAGVLYVLLAGFLMYLAVENGQRWGAFSMFTCALASVVTTIRIRDVLRR